MTVHEVEDTRTVRSFCRVCVSVCGILVDVVGDEVTHVRGDRDHPRSQGYSCTKGRALPKMHHHPDRIERPEMRVDGKLQPTTWDECLDDLATKVRAIIDEHGPDSVGIFFGSGLGMDAAGYRIAQGLHAAIGTSAKFSPLTIDGTAKVLISDLVGGSTALSGRPDYVNTDFVILIGSNPVVSHGHTIAMPNPKGTLKELAQRAEIWVLDPRRTETARLATGHLAPRPGTDHAVLACLVREMLVDGADRDFIDNHTADVEILADAVADFTIEHTARLADIAEADLISLCEAVRRAGPIAVDTGTGVTMSSSANVTQWLSWALMAVKGSLNRKGGYWFHPGFGYQLESFELPVSPAEGSFGPGPRSRPETHSFLDEWPCAVLPDEINTGNIRAVLNLGGNLVTAFPDAGALIPALEKLEVFATIEIIGNETTALSTHVLPTKDQLERADVTLWDIMLPRVTSQHTEAVVEPVGDRKSGWWVLAELGRRLGYDLADTSNDQVTDDAMLTGIMMGARMPIEKVAEKGWVEVPNEVPAAWVDAHVERLGGWRLAPALLVNQLAALEEPADLVLVPRRQHGKLNSQLGYLGEPAEVLMNPADAAAAGVVHGQQVTVRTATGELTGVAKVDDSIRRGAVSIPHGHPLAANVNRLTDKDQIDLVTGMARYGGFPVTVVPG
ncbi:UNVERIFIED_CONTAM: anaerobic selenocysteine-containing dehydrogenase [Williamsia faeni]